MHILRACVLVTLLFSAVTAHADEAPPPAAAPAPTTESAKKPGFIQERVDGYRTRAETFMHKESGHGIEGEGSKPYDATGFLAGLFPRDYRAWGLVALDMALPLVVAMPIALVGSIAGAYGLTQLLHLTSKRDIPLYSPEAISGAALGFVGAGMLSLFIADLLLNSFHLKWLITSRFTGLAITGIGAGALTALLLVFGPLAAGLNPLIPMLILVGGTVLLGAFFVVLVPVALAAGLAMRVLADEDFGSPMWQPGGRTGLE